MQSGTKAYIEGNDMGKRILKKVKSFEMSNMSDLSGLLSKQIKVTDDKVKEYTQQANFDKVGKLSNLQEFLEMTQMIVDISHDLRDCEYKCNTYFGHNKDSSYIRLSSVHKAKGIESDRVFILNPRKFPHQMARTDWELEQEDNLKYVAYTRCMRELIEVNGFDEPKEEIL